MFAKRKKNKQEKKKRRVCLSVKEREKGKNIQEEQPQKEQKEERNKYEKKWQQEEEEKKNPEAEEQEAEEEEEEEQEHRILIFPKIKMCGRCVSVRLDMPKWFEVPASSLPSDSGCTSKWATGNAQTICWQTGKQTKKNHTRGTTAKKQEERGSKKYSNNKNKNIATTKTKGKKTNAGPWGVPWIPPPPDPPDYFLLIHYTATYILETNLGPSWRAVLFYIHIQIHVNPHTLSHVHLVSRLQNAAHVCTSNAVPNWCKKNILLPVYAILCMGVSVCRV